MSPPPDDDEFDAEFEKTGEDEVHKRLVTGRIYHGNKRLLAKDWLQRKDQERKDSLNSEQIEIARDAAAAAWEAARAAQNAAKTAKIAVAIAAIVMIISAIGLFLLK